MSVFYILSTNRQPRKSYIDIENEKVQLENLHSTMFPTFYLENINKYFFYLNGELNYRLISEPKKDASIGEVFNYKFQTERNEKFKAVLQWILEEVRAGNRVSVIRQIETANEEEREEYNSVYETKSISLKSISKLCTDITFDFNTEYIFE